jgi:hypothetical protein
MLTPAATTALSTSAASNAAVIGAVRDTTPDRSSSSRPDSSSARVCRPTTNIAISPTVIAPNADACQATCPPVVFRARAGPAIAMNAAFSPMAAAARSNSACDW